MATLLAVPGLEKTSRAFRRKLLDVAARLRLNPDYMVAVMSFESAGSFSPSKRNPFSNATGLIQFMPSTARSLGTTIDQLARMSAEDQLDYVERYYQPHAGRLRNVEDHYLAVFMPALIGRSPGSNVACAGSPVYDQNYGFDRNRSGCFTVADVAVPVTSIVRQAEKRQRLPVGIGFPPLPYVQLAAGTATGIGLGWAFAAVLITARRKRRR